MPITATVEVAPGSGRLYRHRLWTFSNKRVANVARLYARTGSGPPRNRDRALELVQQKHGVIDVVGLGTLLRRLTARRLILLTFAITIAVGLLLPFATTYLLLVLLAIGAGVGHGITNPTSALLVADVSTSTERGFANAALYLASSAGAVAPMIAVAAASLWGLTSVFPIATLLPAATFIIVAKYMGRLSTERPRDEGRSHAESRKQS